MKDPKIGRILVPIVAVAALAATWLLRKPSEDTLVVYCAHDAMFAEEILNRFKEESGIDVDVRFDEEATKSLGLVNLLIREKDNPRCDVFWNNQLMGTARLKSEGVLQPYKGKGWKRIPEGFKDPDGCWTGFAARLRVFIVNTDRMEATPEAVDAMLAGNDLHDVAIAKPLFGTTLSHYTVLMDRRGADQLREWHESQRARGIREVQGNSMVRDLVASNTCRLGYTDTDDAFGAVDSGAAVDMLPVRLQSGETICIPNTVAIIRGTGREANAQKLVDFLLSADTELLLAKSASRQIPLGKVASDQLPPDVLRLKAWAADSVSLIGLEAAHQKTLDWLNGETPPAKDAEQ